MRSDSGEDQNNVINEAPPPEVRRGRPAGKADSTKRTRRTAQEISDDKIRIAQMRLDALREIEEKRLANKRTRARPSRQAKTVVEESELPKAPKKVMTRDESPPSPKRVPNVNRRQALYDSWFVTR